MRTSLLLVALLLCGAAALSGSSTGQDPTPSPATVKPASLRDVLRGLVGRECGYSIKDCKVSLDFGMKMRGDRTGKIDMVGADFVRIRVDSVEDKDVWIERYWPLTGVSVNVRQTK